VFHLAGTGESTKEKVEQKHIQALNCGIVHPSLFAGDYWVPVISLGHIGNIWIFTPKPMLP
jgi:hypothetical protein